MTGIEAALQGALGRDPELKTSTAGKAWTRVSVAVGPEGETTWVSVACFGEVAQRLCATAKKGTKVYCEGSLKLSEWVGRDGSKRTGLELAAWRAQVIGAGALGENKRKKAAPAAGEVHGANGRDWQRPLDTESEIPF